MFGHCYCRLKKIKANMPYIILRLLFTEDNVKANMYATYNSKGDTLSSMEFGDWYLVLLLYYGVNFIAEKSACVTINSNKIYCWHIPQPITGWPLPSHVVEDLKGFLCVLWVLVSWTIPDVVHLWADIHGGHGRHASGLLLHSISKEVVCLFNTARTTKLKSKLIIDQPNDSSNMFSCIPLIITSINNTQH